MAGNTVFAGKWFKASMMALGAAAMAAPMVSAVATPVDPTQQVVAEEVEATVEEAAAPAPLTAEQIEEGRTLFANWSCSACHVLTDANGNGHIGPSLDGNDNMDAAFIASRITNGQGAMPGFGGQMSEDEIELLAAYVMEAKQ